MKTPRGTARKERRDRKFDRNKLAFSNPENPICRHIFEFGRCVACGYDWWLAATGYHKPTH